MAAKSAKEQASAKRTPASTATAFSSTADSQLWLWLGAALLVIVTLVAYQPAIHAGFIWDDEDILTDNPLIKGGLKDIWFSTKFYDYYPLTLTSLWIEWRLWGMQPAGYHIVNVLLHATTAILFWRVLRRLAIPGAWLAALVFAVHPVNVESAAWIAERKNTLPMVFYVLSILWFLKSQPTTSRFSIIDSGTGSQPSTLNPQPTCWYWLAVIAFFVALLAKTSVVMLPFVLLGCIWWRNGRVTKADVIRSLPFFALSLALGLVTVWVQYHRAISTDIVQTSGFAERLARAGWAVWFYLWKAIWPLNLSFVYPRWQVHAASAVSYLPGIALLVCLGLFWRFRATWGKPLFFALAYFTVTLFPVLGFFSIYFQKYSFVADHWQYTSIIGIIALVVGIGVHRSGKSKAWIIAGLAVAVALAVQTWRQCQIYKNEEALWRDTVRKNPKAAIAWHNLGIELLNRGSVPDAMNHFRNALAADPDHFNAHYALGTCLVMQGQTTEGLRHIHDAVRLKPDFDRALNTLAWLLATHPDSQLRDGREALQFAQRAVDLCKDDPGCLDTLAAAQAENGDFIDAIETTKKAIQLAEAESRNDLIPAIQEHRQWYAKRQPYREMPRP